MTCGECLRVYACIIINYLFCNKIVLTIELICYAHFISPFNSSVQ